MQKGPDTMRKVLIVGISLVAFVAAVNSAVADGTLAGGTRVVTSDATAQFVPIEIGKFVVIDLPADAKDVVVANSTIANAILRTARQVTILGIGNGQTNIAFFDAAHRQIEALDISVQGYPVPGRVPAGPEKIVIIFRGSIGWHSLSCTHGSDLSENASCYSREEPAGNLNDLPKGSSVTMPAGR
jgi:hypothetical protein